LKNNLNPRSHWPISLAPLDTPSGPAYIVSYRYDILAPIEGEPEMNVVIRGKRIEVAREVEAYTLKKLGKIDRILPSVIETKIEISREKAKDPSNRYIVQVTVNSNGTLIRAEERESDLYAAIDAAVDVVRRQARRYKDRFYLRRRRSDRHKRELPPSVESPQVEEEKLPDNVVRTKSFSIKSMTPSEATEQMELLGHDFFIFLDARTDQVNVLYRRKDGNYGLIEPGLV
jgi:putative sigma-54 modulation protein